MAVPMSTAASSALSIRLTMEGIRSADLFVGTMEMGVSDQQKRMAAIFQQIRLKLMDLNAALDKEEAVLEPLMEADPPVTATVRSQIDRLVDWKRPMPTCCSESGSFVHPASGRSCAYRR